MKRSPEWTAWVFQGRPEQVPEAPPYWVEQATIAQNHATEFGSNATLRHVDPGLSTQGRALQAAPSV
jgi:hypothetical protein